MQCYTIFFIAVNALHVSGGFSAHHQELNNCTHVWYMSNLLAATASGSSSSCGSIRCGNNMCLTEQHSLSEHANNKTMQSSASQECLSKFVTPLHVLPQSDLSTVMYSTAYPSRPMSD